MQGGQKDEKRKLVSLTIAAAWLLIGNLALAQQTANEQLGKVSFPTACDRKVQPQFNRAAAMPARIALERGMWKEAAQLEPRSSKVAYTDAMVHLARALGAARAAADSGNSAKAKRNYALLINLAAKGDPRPEIEQARNYLAKN